jgi:hypothetical protein
MAAVVGHSKISDATLDCFASLAMPPCTREAFKRIWFKSGQG